MGFKLIRENSEEYRKKIKEMKKNQLTQETKRWARVTHDQHREEEFLDRFLQITEKSQNQNHPEDKESSDKATESICRKISESKANLATVQGNSDIEKLLELLN